MTMTIIKSGRDIMDKHPKEKEMDEMIYGEVCYVLTNEQYVIKVSKGIDKEQFFLILGSDSSVDRYSGEGACLVRELYKDEPVTIKFS